MDGYTDWMDRQADWMNGWMGRYIDWMIDRLEIE